LFYNSFSGPTWLASVTCDEKAPKTAAEDDIDDDSLVESEAMMFDAVAVLKTTEHTACCIIAV